MIWEMNAIINQHLTIKNMERLMKIEGKADIPEIYQNTPIGLLLEYNNLNRPFDRYETAKMLVGMCMDHRKHLTMPENFSFIIRTGGANLRYIEFNLSFAIAVGRVRHMAIIGHNNCGMVDLKSKKEQFIEGLQEGGGWTEPDAEAHFDQFAPMFEIHNEIDFILSETQGLRSRYPKIQIAPMLYQVGEGKLYLIKES